MQRNLTVKALTPNYPEPYVCVRLVGRDDIPAARPANKREVLVGFI